MPFKQFVTLAAFKADDLIFPDRPADGYGRFVNSHLRAAQICQGLTKFIDVARKGISRNRIARDIGLGEFSRQQKQVQIIVADVISRN